MPEPIAIRSRSDALRYGDDWQARAERLQWENDNLRSDVEFERGQKMQYLELVQSFIAELLKRSGG